MKHLSKQASKQASNSRTASRKEKEKKLYKRLQRERKNCIERNLELKGYSSSIIWHKILMPLLKLYRIMQKQHITVIDDKHENKSTPIIYACTHVGYYDPIIILETVKKHCWIFWGNPIGDLTNLLGRMARKNGTIYVDTYDKEDRKLAKREAEMRLKHGCNLLIFPEGAWNITDNEPVMKLYKGTVSMAINTGAEVVPIALEQYGKEFFVNIGENIHYDSASEPDIDGLTCELRNTLSTLKWEIWEKQPVLARGQIPESYGKTFWNALFEAADGSYTYEMADAERFHD